MGEEVITNDEYLAVDGIKTHVRFAGNGKPLLLLHGLGGPPMWQRIIKPLSAHNRVIILDLPGFGDSDCPPKSYTTVDYADFIGYVHRMLALPKMSIAGVSYGGQLAASLAALHPEIVEKIIIISGTGLIASNIFFRNRILFDVFSKIAQSTVLRSRMLTCALGRLSFYKKESRPLDLCKEFYRQLSQKGKREAWLNVLRNIYTEKKEFLKIISTLQAPTLILWGEKDKTVSLRYGLQLHNRISNSMFKIFPECAHSLPLEKPEELCEAINSFLY